MLGVAVYVVTEAIGRIGEDPEVQTGAMLLVGVIGLGVNIASMLLLRQASTESLNVKGAYLEVVADAAGSVGVIAAGLLILWTGQSWWDTVVAVAIGVFVAIRAVVLGRQVLSVLGQHVPYDVEMEEVIADLGAVPGVGSVHDLHVWTLTSGMNVATAHLVVHDATNAHDVLTNAQSVLATRHRIEHATLQVEATPTKQCHEVTW